MPLARIRGQIRAAVAVGGIRYTEHAEERMAERNVSRQDVGRVLKTGAVRRDGAGLHGPKYAVRGSDLDGRRHKVVVERDNDGEFAVVTVHGI